MKDTEYWQRDGLVARLRMEASVNQGNAKLCGDAADEIERLRITDAEREAIEWYAGFVDGIHAATLRNLLERLG